jgi:KDO2-lipid IV(A) lauroyltransferase
LKKRKKFKRNLEVVAFNGLMCVARTLPRGAGLRVFSLMGTTASHLFRRDRDRAIENLAMAFPETPKSIRKALANAMFKTLGKNFFEFLNLEGSSAGRLEGLVEKVVGKEHMDRALAAGRGVIVITGHIGCWELLAGYFATRGYPVNVVGRELWESRLNERLLKIRGSMGCRTIDRDSGGREIIRALKKRELVAVLIDQHTRVSGVCVPFFNRPAHTPVGAARLAVAMGSPILPMAIYLRHTGRHEIRILPPVELPAATVEKGRGIKELTENCSRAVEELVRYDPKQWVWFHDRWRSDERKQPSAEAVH